MTFWSVYEFCKKKEGTSNVFYKRNNKKIYMIKEEVVNENE